MTDKKSTIFLSVLLVANAHRSSGLPPELRPPHRAHESRNSSADCLDARVDIRPSNDVHYRVYGLRFLLNHGDMLGVKGGDGIIGAIVPIMRGEIKKSGQSAALGLEYDINIMGHWHQELMLPRAIVCNTLKGFDELRGCSCAPSRQGPRSRCCSS